MVLFPIFAHETNNYKEKSWYDFNVCQLQRGKYDNT